MPPLIRPNVIWRWNSSSAPATQGALLKALNSFGEFTALAVAVARAIDGDGVVDVLDRPNLVHGPRFYVRITQFT